MKGKIIGGLATIVVGVMLFLSGIEAGVLGDPIEVYQVYLNGEKIGLIEDKDSLYNLIDTEQVELETLKTTNRLQNIIITIILLLFGIIFAGSFISKQQVNIQLSFRLLR